jgi:hypothetical protein
VCLFKHSSSSACYNFYIFNKYSFISFFCRVVLNSFFNKLYYAQCCLYSLRIARRAIRNFRMFFGYFILFCAFVELGRVFWYTTVCTPVVDVIRRHVAACAIYPVLFICCDHLQFVRYANYEWGRPLTRGFFLFWLLIVII